MKGWPSFISRKQWLIILLAWCVLQALLLYSFGINKNHEALAYLGLRDQWMQGNFQQYGHFWLYSGYIGLHVLIKSLGLPETMLYVLQLLASFFALLAFVKGCSYFTQHQGTVFIAGLLYSTCFLLHAWTSFLYTETIFTSLVTICICSMLFYGSRSWYPWIFWISLALLPFFRPNGFLVMLIPLLYWATQHWNKRKTEFILLTLLFLAFAKFAAWLLNNSPYFYFIRPNAEADIVCSIHSGLQAYIKVPWQQGMSLWYFMYHNPELTIRMVPARLFKALWMTRNHYSTLNNLVTGSSLLVYYVLAIAGIWQLASSRAKDLVWILAGMAIFVAPVVLMCADWNNRLITPLFPLLLWLAAAGVSMLWPKAK